MYGGIKGVYGGYRGCMKDTQDVWRIHWVYGGIKGVFRGFQEMYGGCSGCLEDTLGV